MAAVPPLLAPSLFLQTRCATNRASKAAQEKKKKDQAKAKAKARKVFKSYNPALLDKYSLCDAIR